MSLKLECSCGYPVYLEYTGQEEYGGICASCNLQWYATCEISEEEDGF